MGKGARRSLTKRAAVDAEPSEVDEPVEEPVEEESVNEQNGKKESVYDQNGTWVYSYRESDGEKFVNPWDVRDRHGNEVDHGYKFHPYDGPIYKEVPVVEGFQFPVDPKL